MGYRDQKVISDTRDAKAAEFIGKTGTAFRAGIAQSQRRQEEKKKELEQEEKEQTAGAVTDIIGQIAENPEAIAGLFGGG